MYALKYCRTFFRLALFVSEFNNPSFQFIIIYRKQFARALDEERSAPEQVKSQRTMIIIREAISSASGRVPSHDRSFQPEYLAYVYESAARKRKQMLSFHI
jgi:hypothetical protein